MSNNSVQTYFDTIQRLVSPIELQMAFDESFQGNGPETNWQLWAYAIRWYGIAWSRLDWMDVATNLTAWTLSAPQRHGLFQTIYDHARTKRGRVGWFGNLHILDCAWTGRWLIRWHDDLVHDTKLLSFVEHLGQGLVSIQRPNGTFPSLHPNHLRSRLDTYPYFPLVITATAALFLAELAQLTGERLVIQALVQAIAVLSATLPKQGRVGYDSWLLPRYGLALLKAYRLTGDPKHIDEGLQITERQIKGLQQDKFSKRYGLLPTASSATPELFAAAYRLTMEPHYARKAVQTLHHYLPQPQPALDVDWRYLNALSTWALLEANYPDVLALGADLLANEA